MYGLQARSEFIFVGNKSECIIIYIRRLIRLHVSLFTRFYVLSSFKVWCTSTITGSTCVHLYYRWFKLVPPSYMYAVNVLPVKESSPFPDPYSYLHLVDVPLGIFYGIPLETIRCLPVGLYAVPRRFHGHYHVRICSPLVSGQCYRWTGYNEIHAMFILGTRDYPAARQCSLQYTKESVIVFVPCVLHCVQYCNAP